MNASSPALRAPSAPFRMEERGGERRCSPPFHRTSSGNGMTAENRRMARSRGAPGIARLGLNWLLRVERCSALRHSIERASIILPRSAAPWPKFAHCRLARSSGGTRTSKKADAPAPPEVLRCPGAEGARAEELCMPAKGEKPNGSDALIAAVCQTESPTL